MKRAVTFTFAFAFTFGFAPSTASAETRKLSLADAVAIALRLDPQVAGLGRAKERTKLAVLRSQLDRFSLRVDGQLQELWNKSNLGGPSVYNCAIGTATFQTDPETCMSQGGTPSLAADQSPSSALGAFNVTANLNVPLFTGFRVSSNVKRAQRLDDAATSDIRQARKDTALSVARAYWSARRVGLLRDVQQRVLLRMSEAEAVADARVKAGLASPIDRNRARLRRLQQVATLADFIGQTKEASVQLAVSLETSEDFELIDAPNIAATGPAAIADLISAAKGERPEIRTAELRLQAQHQTLNIARSGFYPQLSAFGLLQFGNNPYNPLSGARSVGSAANPFSNISGNLTLGASLSMNFFDTLNTWTSSNDAKLEESRLVEEKRRVARIVEADVRATHAKLEKLYARRAPLEESVTLAVDNARILEARYKNGEALMIELLDGQVELANAELSLADNTAQLQLAWIELQAALGKVVGLP